MMKGLQLSGRFPLKYCNGMCRFHRSICLWKMRTLTSAQSNAVIPNLQCKKEVPLSNYRSLNGKFYCMNTNYMENINSRYMSTLDHPETQVTLEEHNSTCEKTEELLSSIADGSLIINPDNLVSVLNELQGIVFTNLVSNHPWLIDNPHVVYRQLLMSKKLHFLNCVIEHDGFQQFLLFTEDVLDRVTNDLLPEILVNLIYLGLPHTHPLVHKVYFLLAKYCKEYDIHGLRKIVQVRTILEDRSPTLVNEVHKRVLDLMNADNTEDTNMKDFDSFCRVVSYLNSVFNSHILSDCNEFIRQWYEKLNSAPSPLTIGQYLKFLNISGSVGRKNYTAKISKHVTDKINEDFIQNLDITSMFVISKELKKCNRYSYQISEPMMLRGLELLKSDSAMWLSKLTGLLPVFTKAISADTREYLEQLLIRYIPNADSVNIISISFFIRDINCDNPDVLSTLCVKLMENMDNLPHLSKVYCHILYTLTQNIHAVSQTKVFHDLLCKLTDHLRKIPVHHIIDFHATAYFLLKFSSDIPDILFTRLLDVIPNATVDSLIKYCTLPSMKKSLKPGMDDYWKLVSFQTCVSKAIWWKLNQVQSLQSLLTLLKLVIYSHNNKIVSNISADSKTPSIFTESLSLLAKYTDSLTPNDFLKIVGLLRSVPYCTPPLLESLVSYCMENTQLLNSFHYSRLIKLLAVTGYMPENADDFSAFCLRQFTLDIRYNEVPILAKLWNMIYLCFLQIYPEDYLGEVFTLEYIEEVDRIIHVSNNPSEKEAYRIAMMMLNRFAVLDCPQLNIPWFHETFLTEHPGFIGDKHTAFMRSVKEQLSKLLGGQDFYRVDVQVPYCYNLNLLFVLDGNKKPVTDIKPEMMDTPGYERVVIQPLNKNSYCPNTRIIRGSMQAQSRHLEMMGYKVINVFQMDWIPKDDEINRAHLSKLIFGDDEDRNEQ